MSFSSLPLAIVGGLLALTTAIVVLLYLLRRTPRITPVSNVAFWVAAIERAKPKLLSSTRIPLLSMLITLIAALLIATQIGGPRFGEGVRGTTVVVIEAGRSMQAEDGGRARLVRAVEEAQRWAERASGTGEVAIVRAGATPSVILALTDDTSGLDSALADLLARDADDATTDVDGAVALAESIVRGRGGAGQILVIGDRAPELRTETPLVLVPIGDVADSLGITQLTARRDPVAVGEYAVLVEVGSFTSREGRARLLVRDRDVTVFDQPFTLSAGARQTFTAQGFSSAQGEITAELTDIEIAAAEDVLAADDVAFAVAPPLETTKILLVTTDNPFLEGVLAAHGAFEVTKRADLTGVDNDMLAAHDVVILDRISPPAGFAHHGVLAIAPPRGLDDITLAAALTRPRVTASLASHDALSGVRLDAIRVERAHALRAEPTDAVLIRSGSEALAVARERSGRREIVLGFDLASTDLVERVAFPLFVHHAMRWLSGRKNQAVFAYAPGTQLEVADGVALLDPDGEPLTAEAGILFDTDRAGLYHVGERAVAVSGATMSAALPAPSAFTPEAQLSQMPPLAILLGIGFLFFLSLEWVLLHRGRLG